VVCGVDTGGQALVARPRSFEVDVVGDGDVIALALEGPQLLTLDALLAWLFLPLALLASGRAALGFCGHFLQVLCFGGGAD
jgi:hypothetical protein